MDSAAKGPVCKRILATYMCVVSVLAVKAMGLGPLDLYPMSEFRLINTLLSMYSCDYEACS